MTDYSDDPVTLLFQLGLGPWVTPLRGKIPVLDGWTSLGPASEATVREWLSKRYNIGLRTGERSGIVVIDDDRAKHGESEYAMPPTGLMVTSPTGSRHGYYRKPPSGDCPRNSASLIAPHVDVRGEGGQVVVPPSIHPDAHEEYRWIALGEPAPWPVELLAPKRRTIAVDMTAAPEGGSREDRWAQAAMLREAHGVRTAPEGARNDTLNRAAFALGQIVAGGLLTDEAVRAELLSAAQHCGLSEREASATIGNGIKAGATQPRTAPPPRPSVATIEAPPTAPATGKRHVLLPGSHVLPGTGEYVEQGSDTFASQVLACIPEGAIYRRAGQLGEIHSDAFATVDANRLRSIVDGGVRLIVCAKGKDDDAEPRESFRTCSRDLASIVLAYGQVRGRVRELRHLAAHPVCVGPDFLPAAPGWNAESGVYLTAELDLDPLPIEYARAVLEDLVCDFPFQSPADRANYFGLLLTPLLRPALNEPVPMHLIGSPIERSGKTKLAEIVLGVVITGRRLAAMQLGDRAEEHEKRLLSILLRGQTLLHLDNLTEFIDSAPLASLLTSSEYQGRLLGSSSAPSIVNGLTVVGTGNNVHATGEIAKRIVPIRLLPDTATPEERQNFRHPDLVGYVTAERERVLGALMGLLAHWRTSGRPLHRGGFGGFERWTAVVGGILNAAGYPEWLGNMSEWRGGADDSTQEHAALVREWHERWACEPVAASDVYELAVELDLFGWLDGKSTDRGRRTSFGLRVLNRLVGRIIAGYRVTSSGVGKARRVRLEHV